MAFRIRVIPERSSWRAGDVFVATIEVMFIPHPLTLYAAPYSIVKLVQFMVIGIVDLLLTHIDYVYTMQPNQSITSVTCD